MPIEQKPFVKYTLDEDLDKSSRTFTVRMNKEDDKVINQLKEIFDVKTDSTMLKICMYQYLNVLQQGFSDRYLKYLFKKERKRLSDYKNFE